jgi:hypothetical protein
MRLLERHPTLRVPRLLLGLGLASAFAWLAQSYESNPDNFSVFLFDYQFEFMRRGLLGEATRRLAGGIEPYHVYQAAPRAARRRTSSVRSRCSAGRAARSTRTPPGLAASVR